MWRALGFLESLGDLAVVALLCPSASCSTLPSPKISAWTLYTVMGKGRGQTARVPAVQALCALSELGQIAVGKEPQFSYP